MNGHRSAVTAAAFNPLNEAMLVTGGGDAAIKVWQLSEDNSAVEVAALSGHTHPITALDFHPCAADVLVSASVDGTVRYVLAVLGLPSQNLVREFCCLVRHGQPIPQNVA